MSSRSSKPKKKVVGNTKKRVPKSENIISQRSVSVDEVTPTSTPKIRRVASASNPIRRPSSSSASSTPRRSATADSVLTPSSSRSKPLRTPSSNNISGGSRRRSTLKETEKGKGNGPQRRPTAKREHRESRNSASELFAADGVEMSKDGGMKKLSKKQHEAQNILKGRHDRASTELFPETKGAAEEEDERIVFLDKVLRVWNTDTIAEVKKHFEGRKFIEFKTLGWNKAGYELTYHSSHEPLEDSDIIGLIEVPLLVVRSYTKMKTTTKRCGGGWSLKACDPLTGEMIDMDRYLKRYPKEARYLEIKVVDKDKSITMLQCHTRRKKAQKEVNELRVKIAKEQQIERERIAEEARVAAEKKRKEEEERKRIEAARIEAERVAAEKKRTDDARLEAERQAAAIAASRSAEEKAVIKKRKEERAARGYGDREDEAATIAKERIMNDPSGLTPSEQAQLLSLQKVKVPTCNGETPDVMITPRLVYNESHHQPLVPHNIPLRNGQGRQYIKCSSCSSSATLVAPFRGQYGLCDACCKRGQGVTTDTITRTVTFNKQILFVAAEDVFISGSGEVVDLLAKCLIDNPLPVQIEGHTDGGGDGDWSMDLSQRRATAVMNRIVNKARSSGSCNPDTLRTFLFPIGVGGQRVSTVGDNKRVEVHFLDLELS